MNRGADCLPFPSLPLFLSSSLADDASSLLKNSYTFSKDPWKTSHLDSNCPIGFFSFLPYFLIVQYLVTTQALAFSQSSFHLSEVLFFLRKHSSVCHKAISEEITCFLFVAVQKYAPCEHSGLNKVRSFPVSTVTLILLLGTQCMQHDRENLLYVSFCVHLVSFSSSDILDVLLTPKRQDTPYILYYFCTSCLNSWPRAEAGRVGRDKGSGVKR